MWHSIYNSIISLVQYIIAEDELQWMSIPAESTQGYDWRLQGTCYPLVIEHSTGTCSIYRWFMIIYLSGILEYLERWCSIAQRDFINWQHQPGDSWENQRNRFGISLIWNLVVKPEIIPWAPSYPTQFWTRPWRLKHETFGYAVQLPG